MGGRFRDLNQPIGHSQGWLVWSGSILHPYYFSDLCRPRGAAFWILLAQFVGGSFPLPPVLVGFDMLSFYRWQASWLTFHCCSIPLRTAPTATGERPVDSRLWYWTPSTTAWVPGKKMAVPNIFLAKKVGLSLSIFLYFHTNTHTYIYIYTYCMYVCMYVCM